MTLRMILATSLIASLHAGYLASRSAPLRRIAPRETSAKPATWPSAMPAALMPSANSQINLLMRKSKYLIAIGVLRILISRGIGIALTKQHGLQCSNGAALSARYRYFQM